LCEYVVSYEIERRAEMLSSLSSQHTTAGTGQAIHNLERGDEGHHLTDEVYDQFDIAEEIPIYLFIFLRRSETMMTVPVITLSSAKRCLMNLAPTVSHRPMALPTHVDAATPSPI
jgi:hypothetical protein